ALTDCRRPRLDASPATAAERRLAAARTAVRRTRDVIDEVNPPDYAIWPTTRRLLRVWREQWRLVLLGLGCAVAYTSISLTIPILIARAIDHAIVRHDRPLWEYMLPI